MPDSELAPKHVLLGVQNIEEAVLVLVGVEDLLESLVGFDNVLAVVDHEEETLFLLHVQLASNYHLDLADCEGPRH